MKPRTIRVRSPWVIRALRAPIRHSHDSKAVFASPYSWRRCASPGCYVLSTLSLLNRWLGLSIQVPVE